MTRTSFQKKFIDNIRNFIDNLDKENASNSDIEDNCLKKASVLIIFLPLALDILYESRCFLRLLQIKLFPLLNRTVAIENISYKS